MSADSLGVASVVSGGSGSMTGSDSGGGSGISVVSSVGGGENEDSSRVASSKESISRSSFVMWKGSKVFAGAGACS